LYSVVASKILGGGQQAWGETGMVRGRCLALFCLQAMKRLFLSVADLRSESLNRKILTFCFIAYSIASRRGGPGVLPPEFFWKIFGNPHAFWSIKKLRKRHGVHYDFILLQSHTAINGTSCHALLRGHSIALPPILTAGSADPLNRGSAAPGK